MPLDQIPRQVAEVAILDLSAVPKVYILEMLIKNPGGQREGGRRWGDYFQISEGWAAAQPQTQPPRLGIGLASRLRLCCFVAPPGEVARAGVGGLPSRNVGVRMVCRGDASPAGEDGLLPRRRGLLARGKRKGKACRLVAAQRVCGSHVTPPARLEKAQDPPPLQLRAELRAPGRAGGHHAHCAGQSGHVRKS